MKVLLGITGSVATVLTQKLVKALLDGGHEVKIVATNPALYFLKTPPFDPEKLIMDVFGQQVEVYLDKYEWPAGGYHKDDPVRHIEFRDWADVLLIAPLSANRPKERPMIIAPAMNTEMWNDPITTEQIKEIKRRYTKLLLVNPISKVLACGDDGIGAMANIEDIAEAVLKI
ncbi:MAG: hypothetical protein NT165_02045 [Candidatus Falkowbacteria bacterium]|nr:hypothetical protein [Candidatus Falkowbacteria bacterium]